jgi:hypothetical protein
MLCSRISRLLSLSELDIWLHLMRLSPPSRDVQVRVRELCLAGWRDDRHDVFSILVGCEQDKCQKA